MRLGEFIVGEYLGVDPDTSFGSRLKIRVGEPTEKNPIGFSQNVDFFPFDPQSGQPTLPANLKVHDYVVVMIDTRGKGYRSQDRGIGGMVTRKLISISVVGQWEDGTTRALTAEEAG